MRKTCALTAALLAFSSVVCAQEAIKQPAPALPSEILGLPLVAWSAMQKPRPVPEPLPPPDNRADQSQTTQPQTAQTQTTRPAGQEAQEHASQTFTGMIARDHGKFVLKVSENVWYQIDDQDKARAYEGKQVKIAGNLDAKSNLLHVASIELLS